VTLRTKSVYSAFFSVFPFFAVLATRYSQGSWTDFDAKYAKTRGFPQVAYVPFRGREHKI